VNGLRFGKCKEIPLAKQNWEIITSSKTYWAYQDDFTLSPKDVEKKRKHSADPHLQSRETTIYMVSRKS
jgi:hypothetical protein